MAGVHKSHPIKNVSAFENLTAKIGEFAWFIQKLNRMAQHAYHITNIILAHQM